LHIFHLASFSATYGLSTMLRAEVQLTPHSTVTACTVYYVCIKWGFYDTPHNHQGHRQRVSEQSLSWSLVYKTCTSEYTQNDCHRWLSDRFKVHQIRFRPELCPWPHWGSLQCSPDLLAGLKGPTSKGGEEKGRGGKENRNNPAINSCLCPWHHCPPDTRCRQTTSNVWLMSTDNEAE